jgi:hypothetical protein
MDYDKDKVDEVVLALLYLTMHGDGSGTRAWKGHDWDTLGRLHEKGFIGDPGRQSEIGRHDRRWHREVGRTVPETFRDAGLKDGPKADRARADAIRRGADIRVCRASDSYLVRLPRR